MQDLRHLWERRWVRHGVVPLAFYLAAALVLTYPVITQLETHAAGAPYGDAFEAVRLIWWTKEALLHGMHPAYQPLLAYPDGFFSPVQWASPMAHLAGLPFAFLFSPLAAYNLTFLASHVLTGLAAYLFCWELTRRQSAALLGGLILMAFPTRLGHATAGHLTLLTNYWLLLYAWSLVRVWSGAGWRTAALGGVFFTFALGAYPTNLVYELIPLTAAFCLVMAWKKRAAWRPLLRPLLTLGVVAVIGLLILYGPLLISVLQGDTRSLEGVGVVQYSADLLAFLTPSPFNPVLSGLGLVPGWAWDVLGDNNIEGPAYLGVVGIALATLALWPRRAEAWPWLLVALAGMILSLGPVLKVADRVIEISIENGQTTNIALPYAFYSAVPGLGMGRTPARLNMVTAVAWAALAAVGFAALIERLPRLSRPAWQGGGLIGLAALVMVEYQLFAPFPTTPAPIPTYFEELAEDAANGVVRPVLNLPTSNFFVTRWLLYYQTAHHQPVLAGHVVRDTPANPAMLALANAAALPPVEDDIVPAMTLEQQVAVLRATGAAVIVVHRAHGDAMTNGPEMAAHLRDVLGAPIYEDDHVTIFEVPDGLLPDEPLYATTGGWLDAAPAGETPTRWLEDELYVSFYLPDDHEGFWQFAASPWLYERQLRLDLDQTGTDTYLLAAEDHSLWSSSIYRQPGWFHQVRFWVDDEGDGCTRLPGEPGCRRAAIGTPRFVFREENQTLQVDFGATMRLMSFDGQAEPGRYDLALQWQALGPERGDYTLFAHLLDEHGEMVRQWDGPLLGAGLPTSQWPQNGIAVQRATLDVGGLSGTYQLYVGLYTYPDMTRLPVHAAFMPSDRPSAFMPRAAEGMLYLQEVVIPAEGSASGER